MAKPSFARNAVSGCGCATGCLGAFGGMIASALLALAPFGQVTASEAVWLRWFAVPVLVVCVIAMLVGPIGWIGGLLLDPAEGEADP